MVTTAVGRGRLIDTAAVGRILSYHSLCKCTNVSSWGGSGSEGARSGIGGWLAPSTLSALTSAGARGGGGGGGGGMLEVKRIRVNY